MNEIEDMLSRYGTGLKQTRTLVNRLAPMLKTRKTKSLFPEIPSFFTPDELSQAGLPLPKGVPENWLLKAIGIGGKEPQVSYITDTNWQFLEDGGAISATGRKYTPKQLAQEYRKQEFGDIAIKTDEQLPWSQIDIDEFQEKLQVEKERLAGLVSRTFTTIGDVLKYVKTAPEAFLQTVRNIGRSEDKKALLMALGTEEGMTAQEIEPAVNELLPLVTRPPLLQNMMDKAEKRKWEKPKTATEYGAQEFERWTRKEISPEEYAEKAGLAGLRVPKTESEVTPSKISDLKQNVGDLIQNSWRELLYGGWDFFAGIERMVETVFESFEELPPLPLYQSLQKAIEPLKDAARKIPFLAKMELLEGVSPPPPKQYATTDVAREIETPTDLWEAFFIEYAVPLESQKLLRDTEVGGFVWRGKGETGLYHPGYRDILIPLAEFITPPKRLEELGSAGWDYPEQALAHEVAHDVWFNVLTEKERDDFWQTWQSLPSSFLVDTINMVVKYFDEPERYPAEVYAYTYQAYPIFYKSFPSALDRSYERLGIANLIKRLKLIGVQPFQSSAEWEQLREGIEKKIQQGQLHYLPP